MISTWNRIRGELSYIDVMADGIVRFMRSDMRHSNLLVLFLAVYDGHVDVTSTGDLFVGHVVSLLE